jgi:hypothetical protein
LEELTGTRSFILSRHEPGVPISPNSAISS